MYQLYAHQSPQHVHALLQEMNASYVIIENGICLSSDESHCQLIDIIDLHNGHVSMALFNIFNFSLIVIWYSIYIISIIMGGGTLFNYI